MRMRSNSFTLFIITIVLFSLTTKINAEIIFKKDGSLVQGTVTRDAANYITVRKEDRKMERIYRRDITRILYTKLYMGKVFVRMTDGRVLEVYKVDEDQDTYTFRKVLTSPEEITVKREKVMFIAMSNPTDLTAKAKQTEIDLKWSPPFRPPKSYKIYLKTKDTKFAVAATTSSTEYTLENLKSNTRYWTKVTALDSEGIESTPSDEVRIVTKNIPPSRPRELTIKVIPKSNGKIVDAVVSWKEATDRDGTVKKYIIYRKTDKGFEQTGQIKSTSYTITGLNALVNHAIIVRAVDDSNDESEDSNTVYSRSDIRFQTAVRCAYLYPFGKFGDLAEWGAGGLAGLGVKGLFFNEFALGLEAGYFYFGGADSISRVMIVPMTVQVSYTWWPLKWIGVTPRISGGYSYISISYSYLDAYMEKTDIDKNSFEVTVGGGFSIDFLFSNQWKISAGADAWAIIEKEDILKFAGFFISAGILF